MTLEQQQNDLWEKVSSKMNCKVETTELTHDAFLYAMPTGHSHCVSSEADIKIQFQDGRDA